MGPKFALVKEIGTKLLLPNKTMTKHQREKFIKVFAILAISAMILGSVLSALVLFL